MGTPYTSCGTVPPGKSDVYSTQNSRRVRCFVEKWEKKRPREKGGDSEQRKAAKNICEVATRSFVCDTFLECCKGVAALAQAPVAEKNKRSHERIHCESSRLVQKAGDKLTNRIVGRKTVNAGFFIMYLSSGRNVSHVKGCAKPRDRKS